MAATNVHCRTKLDQDGKPHNAAFHLFCTICKTKPYDRPQCIINFYLTTCTSFKIQNWQSILILSTCMENITLKMIKLNSVLSVDILFNSNYGKLKHNASSGRLRINKFQVYLLNRKVLHLCMKPIQELHLKIVIISQPAWRLEIVSILTSDSLDLTSPTYMDTHRGVPVAENIFICPRLTQFLSLKMGHRPLHWGIFLQLWLRV